MPNATTMPHDPQPRRNGSRDRLWLVAVALLAAASAGLLFVRPRRLSSDHDWLLHVARYAFVRQSICDAGQFPYWSPYFGGGYPILGDPAGAALTPQVPFVLALGEVVGLKAFVAMLVVVHAIGMFALLRWGLRVEAWAAAAGALLLAFSANLPLRNWDELAYGLLPLMLFVGLRLRSRPKWLWALAGLLAVALPQGKQCWALAVGYLAAFVVLHGVRVGRRRLVVSPGWGLAVAAAVMVACLLAWAKLLPMAELFRQRREAGVMAIRNKAPFYGPATVNALAPRDLAEGIVRCRYEPGVGLRSWCCVGWVGAVLALAGIALRWRRTWRPLLLAAAAAAATVGWHCDVDLLRLLWLVPGLDTIRSSAKYLDYFVCLGLCLCAAWGLAGLAAKWGPWVGIIVAVAALFEAGGKNLPPVLSHFHRVPPRVSRADPFHHRMSIARGPAAPRTANGTTYLNLLAGIGTMNWESGFSLPEHAQPRDFVGPDGRLRPNPDYRGEAYVAEGAGTARIKALSPNRIVVEGTLKGPAKVAVNQNAHPGWVCDSRAGGTAHIVHDGTLLAASVGQPGRFELEFRFVPKTFYVGSMVSVAALIGLVAGLAAGEPRGRGRLVAVRVRRTVLLALALVVAAGAGAGWWLHCRSWAKASAQYELGRQAYVTGDVHRAALRFAQALALRPGHMLARKRLAQCWCWQGRFAQAAAGFRSCGPTLVLESDDVIHYAVALCEQGARAEAERTLAQWRCGAPSSPHVWAAAAVIRAQRAGAEPVLLALRRAVDLGLEDLSALRLSPRVAAILDTAPGRALQQRMDALWRPSQF